MKRRPLPIGRRDVRFFRRGAIRRPAPRTDLLPARARLSHAPSDWSARSSQQPNPHQSSGIRRNERDPSTAGTRTIRRVPAIVLSGGALAQLGERQLCKLEVIGSIPIRSTSESPANPGLFIGAPLVLLPAHSGWKRVWKCLFYALTHFRRRDRLGRRGWHRPGNGLAEGYALADGGDERPDRGRARAEEEDERRCLGGDVHAHPR